MALDEQLVLCANDSPGPGGACHEYTVHEVGKGLQNPLCSINFQKGPVLENGLNGISQEVLLEIAIHRLQGFQSGEYACRENALALTKIQEALMWLNARTNDRIKRGVEGTSEK